MSGQARCPGARCSGFPGQLAVRGPVVPGSDVDHRDAGSRVLSEAKKVVDIARQDHDWPWLSESCCGDYPVDGGSAGQIIGADQHAGPTSEARVRVDDPAPVEHPMDGGVAGRAAQHFGERHGADDGHSAAPSSFDEMRSCQAIPGSRLRQAFGVEDQRPGSYWASGHAASASRSRSSGTGP